MAVSPSYELSPSDTMNEWEFTALVASWINAILTANPELPFSEVRCEQRSSGSQQRNDLTLLDHGKKPVLTGEVKLPYQKDGSTPYNKGVVIDARGKARRAGTPLFFTWNVNQCVLWRTDRAGAPDEEYRFWKVTQVHRPGMMEHPSVQRDVQQWLLLFLREVARVLHGTGEVGRKAPDQRFIDRLESALERPVALSLEQLWERYTDQRDKLMLDRWMRDEQGWVLVDDTEGIRDLLERAAKFACYALVNKLVFYEALLKRYANRMHALTVPQHTETGEGLRLHLEGLFAEAKQVTNDYESVFGETHASIGNRIPFLSDAAVHPWRELIEQIHEFDFSKLDYEVIGSIFERLISPEERHKYGQYYTSVEVVDLINSFCIRTGDEKVLDPACGGGTFLVRAYARKRELNPGRTHGERLTDLHGVDLSHFATHLTTINLATRDLVDDENYPRVVRSDFFDVEADKAFLTLPRSLTAGGLGRTQRRQISIPPLDAVIGNPPYVRQEHIPRSPRQSGRGKPRMPARGTKEYYHWLVHREAALKLSGRSDLHCYFWPHATRFLKDDGWLAFVTSSQWLDVEYGFRLQGWILNNFRIVAVLESVDEPWFVGARVASTVTILRRERDAGRRAANVVRFVQLRKPMREILSHDGSTWDAVRVADDFRNEILTLTENTLNDRYRARLVPQHALWSEGVRLGTIMSRIRQSDAGEDEESEPDAEESIITPGTYFGGKWGVFLRAPDLWFALLDQHGSRFVPLGQLAEVRFGVKTGKDAFFFPRDVSAEILGKSESLDGFESTYGVPRDRVESGEIKLVRCGEGYEEIRPIEARYLEPEVHSLMEVGGYSVSAEDCSRMILLVGDRRANLKGTLVLDYILWGEKQGWHEGSTCRSRATESREWYDLTGHRRGEMFWPMAQQYKHAVPTNDEALICNHNLFDVSPREHIHPNVLAGVLNSSLVVLSKYQYGRPVGVEGNLKTEVVDTNMMLVPDPRAATPAARARVARAFEAMKGRKAMQFLSERRMREMAFESRGRASDLARLSDQSELDQADRHELDDAVLELLGVRAKAERREWLTNLYAYLELMFEQTRAKEEKAIGNKNRTRRRGAVRPGDVAALVWEQLETNHAALLRRYDPDVIDRKQPYDTYDVPLEGEPQEHSTLFYPHCVLFTRGGRTVGSVEVRSKAQSSLLASLARSGIRGLVRVPYEPEESQRVHRRYEDLLVAREERIRTLVAERATDPDLQEKVVDLISAKLLSPR
jgi:hypothetical protein